MVVPLVDEGYSLLGKQWAEKVLEGKRGLCWKGFGDETVGQDHRLT